MTPASQRRRWAVSVTGRAVLQRVTDGGNRTVSTVTLTPRVEHSGQSVKCRAVNTDLRAEVIEQSWRLTVYCEYRPGGTLPGGAGGVERER